MDNNAFREIEDGEKMKKNVVRTLITMLILTMAMTLSTYAAAAIKRTQYESNGKVEVEFKTRVQYKR